MNEVQTIMTLQLVKYIVSMTIKKCKVCREDKEPIERVLKCGKIAGQSGEGDERRILCFGFHVWSSLWN